ncbi:hypothetical protein [Trujillonella humicola]|uniref:hypothetical protein n=1 Tax=Trujillonella humicola TaxID=3383699 RepID=UPI0039059037
MRPSTARSLTVPGLLLALVLTSTLPAWAGAASDRPADPATVCAVDAAAGEPSGGPRC